jgi:hypothetical protein
MNSVGLRKTALGRDLAVKYPVASATGRISSQQKPARLRRRGPALWAALVLLLLAADFLLAYLAWLAVDFVMR